MAITVEKCDCKRKKWEYIGTCESNGKGIVKEKCTNKHECGLTYFRTRVEYDSNHPGRKPGKWEYFSDWWGA